MLQSVLESNEGVIEGCYGYPHLWAEMAQSFRAAPIFLGDPENGPFLELFNSGPSDLGLLPPHHHRTDSFRMPVAHQTEQLKESGKWLGEGDFYLMAANQVYTETVSPDGHMVFLVYGDRRGGAAIMAKGDPVENTQQFRSFLAGFGFEDTPLHQTDEDAVLGLSTTLGELRERTPRLLGSMSEDSSWVKLSDGSTVAAVLLADPKTGPLVLLTNNAPGAIEGPHGSHATDSFRLIVKGSCTVGEREYKSQHFRATEAGVEEGPIVHGPEGSTQVLVFADRRGWLPKTYTNSSEYSRFTEIRSVLDDLIARG